jgi:hypothetical protein
MTKKSGECPKGGPHTPVYARTGTFTLRQDRTGGVRTKGHPKALKCSKCRRKL